MQPENQLLEKEISIANHHFISFSGFPIIIHSTFLRVHFNIKASPVGVFNPFEK